MDNYIIFSINIRNQIYKKKKLPKEEDMFDKNFVKGGKVAVGKKLKKKPEENFFAIRKSCVSRTCKHGVQEQG